MSDDGKLNVCFNPEDPPFSGPSEDTLSALAYGVAAVGAERGKMISNALMPEVLEGKWDLADLEVSRTIPPLREFQTSEMRQGATLEKWVDDYFATVRNVQQAFREERNHMTERTEIPPADPNVGYRARIDRALNDLSAALDSAGAAAIPLTDQQRVRLAELMAWETK